MKRFTVLYLMLALLVCPTFSSAGQTIVIDADPGGSVLVDGNGNTVIINSDVDSGGGQVIGGGNTVIPGGVPVAGNNTVIVNSGYVDSVFGGSATVASGAAVVSGNSVIVNNGGVYSVFGGSATAESGTAVASGNSVFINGGTVTGEIVGGYAHGAAGRGTATHNTVTISGSPALLSANLYGGRLQNTGDDFTGNTLNVWNYSGGIVGRVENFEFLNFVFPAAQSSPILPVSVPVLLGDAVAGKASTITAGTPGGSAPLRAGDSVTLVGGSIADNGFNSRAAGRHGATLLYDWGLAVDAGALVATLNGVRAAPQVKALSEGFLSGPALASRGADLVAGAGMAQAVHAAAGSGANAFAAFSGGTVRHDTGSHVDMNSFSLMTGFSKGLAVDPGRLALAAFFEHGRGSYDTYNSFAGAASVRGDGRAQYTGGGVLVRVDFAETASGTFHAEASARVGGVRNEYGGGGVRDAMGRAAGYDASSLYCSVHAGGGYLWKISEAASLDLSAAYLWTGVRGDDVVLATGDPVAFRNANSHRARVGARYAYAAGGCVSPYAGAAYEHEFAGTARASSYGYAITAPSLRGGTGIAEVGMALAPSAALPLSFDLGVQGYVGKRRGVSATARAQFAF